MANGRILELVKTDANRIITDIGFETDIIIQRGTISVSIKGIAPTIHLSVDTDNVSVNSGKSRVTIYEKSLTDLSYPVRNSKNNVQMIGDRISYIDNSGTTKTFKVAENWADDTTGVIVLILEKYELI